MGTFFSVYSTDELMQLDQEKRDALKSDIEWVLQHDPDVRALVGEERLHRLRALVKQKTQPRFARLSAGSAMDVVARIVAPALSTRLNQTVIVENRPGGGTTVGTRVVATAAPDGYTLLFTGVAHTLGPALFKNLGYDPVKDFTAIAT